MTKRRIRQAHYWICLTFLAAACQGWMATPDPAGPTPPSGQATDLPATTSAWPPTWTVQPSPTFTVASVTPDPVSQTPTFTLTILHTGQVYGEIMPCG
ncbi:MAG: hypothetical protein JXM73_14770 [Anaerolineae bacterium]|nr:hypothetical protein [Anaerolineae bacterium]